MVDRNWLLIEERKHENATVFLWQSIDPEFFIKSLVS